MSYYYTYIVELAERLHRGSDRPLVTLDYGCGTGKITRLALGRGHDAHGVDLFYGGSNARAVVEKADLWQTRIFPLLDGKFIPFGDGKFDVVLSNQVFEHIDDFTVPLQEIARVLKPSGVFINIFPSDSVWREGHIGIPFSHWMPKGSAARYWYTLALRSLGLGYGRKNFSRRDWTERKLAWIDDWTHYKPLAQIVQSLERHFSIEFYEADYLIVRFEQHPYLRHLAPLVRARAMKPLVAFISNRLAGHIFVLRKPK